MHGSIIDAKILSHRDAHIQRYAVTAQQMGDIEARVFAAGMPVAALMEKVAGRISQRITNLYPDPSTPMGILVGPGHNGGDALVVARELHLQGYPVRIFRPFERLKELTAAHAQYAASLGIAASDRPEIVADCEVLIDGLFGFGLTRPLEGAIAQSIAEINAWQKPVLSIDLPSGIHTDTGAALGTPLRAHHTFCLGLWKRAFLQDQALPFVGSTELIDFGLPLADIEAVLGRAMLDEPELQRITPAVALCQLPLPRSPITHKYQEGHALLICGSRQYTGAALLAGLSARASGVGMLTIAVPEAMRSLVVAQIPDALVVGCEETSEGAIACLPTAVDLSRFQAIGCGPGLTPRAIDVVKQALAAPVPLVLDADGLNILASLDAVAMLRQRHAPTVLTPHPGEFRRLFPSLAEAMGDRLRVTQQAAQASGAIVLLKGAKVAIASPQGKIWVNPESTPALARGGSGDVLTGLITGLLAQNSLRARPPEQSVQTATWWHAHAGRWAAHKRTEIGVDASTLLQTLIPSLQDFHFT